MKKLIAAAFTTVIIVALFALVGCGEIHLHSYDGWTQITPADCENAGSETATCSACGYVATRNISSLGHYYDFENAVTLLEATCEEYGVIEAVCANEGCSSSAKTYTSKAEHSFLGEETVTCMPTCTQQGTKDIACSFGCGTTTNAYIPMLLHSFTGEYVLTNHPSCKTKAVLECACDYGCGVVDVKDGDYGGHSFLDGICSLCGQPEAQKNSPSFVQGFYQVPISLRIGFYRRLGYYAA